MNYIESLNHLDQLKDYVQTSLSSRQNVQQITIVQRDELFEQDECSEQSEDVQQIEDPLSLKEELEENKSVEKMEGVSTAGMYDLIEIFKEEASDEGDGRF